MDKGLDNWDLEIENAQTKEGRSHSDLMPYRSVDVGS
jgi:hypothetical protein